MSISINLGTFHVLVTTYLSCTIAGGTRFRPFIDKDEELYAVVTEICRSLKLTYDSTVKVHGIELYRFTPPEKEFLTGDVNPDNKGFCVTGPEKKCLPSGLLDVSVCKGSTATPFVASSPHFYFGDPRLSEMLKLKPEKTVHATFLDVEPNTGLTMQGHKRLQLNLAVSSFSIMNILLNVNTSSPVFLPVFFTDESAIISEDDADDFKKKVLLPLRVAEVFPFVMIALGGLCLLIILIIAAWHCDRMTKRQTITNEKGVVMENYAVKS